MKSVCVFCGSNIGASEEYKKVAHQLGILLANNNIELIYGGANVGLMKATAQMVLDHGGKATGVITHFLAQKHLTQDNLYRLIKVETMHERKAKMTELADGFIAMPGGFGTLEELFEVLTSAQLGFHHKPIAILNINGFYDLLKAQLDKMVDEKMLLLPHAKMILFVETPEQALEAMRAYEAPVLGKWIDDIREQNKL